MKKKTWIIIAAVVVLVAAMVAAYLIWGRPQTNEGSKELTIEVVDKDGKSTVYEVKTDAEFLRQAMEEADGLEFSGSEGDYGMMVDTVNGVTADYSVDGGYWGFFVNGEYCNFGIDSQPVADGDAFQIIYTIG